MSEDDNLKASMGSMSLSETPFHSLNRPHQQRIPNQFNVSDDFLRPISVKSKQWNSRKVDIHDMKVIQGPFAKYASKHVIEPPSNTDIFIPPKNQLAGSFLNQENIKSNVTDEADNVKAKELIADLLKPKEYPKEPVDPKDKIIPGLKAELYDHQVYGLKFLLQRESVKRKNREYINLVYGPQTDSKDQTLFNVGGILADDMGLGKTVQILALILKNQNKKKEKELKDKTTLIVCPASLICQWCSEIEKKTPSLKVLSYHGTKRPTESSIVYKYDVVVTSYQTLSSEFAKKSSPLFDKECPFRRVVLDEAHTIKNSDTKAHEACSNVFATRRWCLTGTPIQNKIDELQSLFKFIGVNQYEDYQIWRVKISNLLSSKQPKDSSQALKRLHTLLDKYMLRRTKQVLIDNGVLTVRKNIHQEVIDFTPFERTIYDKLKAKIITSILGTDVTTDDNGYAVLNNNENIALDYMCAFTYLLRLRQLCCHWELLFNLTQQCSDDSLTAEISEGLHLKNDKNTMDKIEDTLFDDELQSILDSMKSMNIDDKKRSDSDGSIEPSSTFDQLLHAIKLQRILNILKKDDPLAPRKTIIFSEFTSMLNILETVLMENQIRFVRYDGTMDKQSKDDALKTLDENPGVHVLLCSLKCGAYGLNIVSCSRVILYEPFWNPAIGSQAIDRAYRIGQLRDVDVYEFFVSDTIEMRIKELQDQKKDLMKAVVDKDAKSAAKVIGNGLSKSELLNLLGIRI